MAIQTSFFLFQYDRLMFNFPYCKVQCLLHVPTLEYCQLQFTGSRMRDAIITVRVPALVTAELGLQVPIQKYRQLQHDFPYCRHSLRLIVAYTL